MEAPTKLVLLALAREEAKRKLKVANKRKLTIGKQSHSINWCRVIFIWNTTKVNSVNCLIVIACWPCQRKDKNWMRLSQVWRARDKPGQSRRLLALLLKHLLFRIISHQQQLVQQVLRYHPISCISRNLEMNSSKFSICFTKTWHWTIFKPTMLFA